jgi:hypothetical protein
MIRRWDDFAGALKEIGTTRSTPALPWITARGRDPAPIARALREAVARLSAEDRDALGLLGTTWIAPKAYLSLPLAPLPQANLPASPQNGA